MPLWPQLEEILQPYTDHSCGRAWGTLLFPAEDGGLIEDWRKLLDRIAERAGWRAGEDSVEDVPAHLPCGAVADA